MAEIQHTLTEAALNCLSLSRAICMQLALLAASAKLNSRPSNSKLKTNKHRGLDQKKAELPPARSPPPCRKMGWEDRSKPRMSGIPGTWLCQGQPQHTRQPPALLHHPIPSHTAAAGSQHCSRCQVGWRCVCLLDTVPAPPKSMRCCQRWGGEDRSRALHAWGDAAQTPLPQRTGKHIL